MKNKSKSQKALLVKKANSKLRNRSKRRKIGKFQLLVPILICLLERRFLIENPVKQFTLNAVPTPTKCLKPAFGKLKFQKKKQFSAALREIGKQTKREGYLFEQPDQEHYESSPSSSEDSVSTEDNEDTVISDVEEANPHASSSDSKSTNDRFSEQTKTDKICEEDESSSSSGSKSTNERFFDAYSLYVRPDYMDSGPSSDRYCLRLKQDRAERLRIHRQIENGGRPLCQHKDIEALYGPDYPADADPDEIFAAYSDETTRKPRGYSRRSRYEARNYSEETDPLFDRESGSDRFARKMVNLVFAERSGQAELPISEYMYSPTQCRAEIERLHKQKLLPEQRNDLDWLCDNDVVQQVGYPKFSSDLAAEFSALSSNEFFVHDLHTYEVSFRVY